MGPKHYNRPGGCYEMMTKEVIPFKIKGIVYYQGESDHQNVHLYQHALQTLFDRYRIDFNNSELPIFLFKSLITYILELPKMRLRASPGTAKTMFT
jgi:sialate O-acetylesterase